MSTPIFNCLKALVLPVALITSGCSGESGHISVQGERDTLTMTDIRIADNIRLNLCGSVVESQEARRVYSEVFSTFYYDNLQTPVDSMKITIDSTHLDPLKNEASQGHPDHTCGGFVTGLKISFGLDNNQPELLFQPAYFCRVEGDTFTAHPVGPIQVYGSGGFSDAASTQLNWMTNYYAHIKFKTGSQLRAFDSAGDSTDVRAIYVTFQALSAVMRHNNTFRFTIWDYKAVMPANGAVRHTMILGPGNVSPFTDGIPKSVLDKLWLFSNFQNNFADRSNLCPPSCELVTFSVAVSGQADCQ